MRRDQPSSRSEPSQLLPPTRRCWASIGRGEAPPGYMHLSPAAIDSAIRMLDQRGNTVATAAAIAEDINKYREKLLAEAGFEPDMV